MILKAFTKTYAMAGLRLGYCLCRFPSLLEVHAPCRPSLETSLPRRRRQGLRLCRREKAIWKPAAGSSVNSAWFCGKGLESLGFRVWIQRQLPVFPRDKGAVFFLPASGNPSARM